MQNIIEKFKGINKGKSLKELVDTYYDLLMKIDEYKKNKNFNKMLECCQTSIPLIEPLIEETKKDCGAFDIKSIPAIEIGSKFWAIRGMEEQLMNTKEIIDYFPELTPWKETINSAFKIKDLTPKIYEYIKNNKGCLQKELKHALGIDDGTMIANILYYLELTGKIKRKKIKNTYSLSIKSFSIF